MEREGRPREERSKEDKNEERGDTNERIRRGDNMNERRERYFGLAARAMTQREYFGNHARACPSFWILARFFIDCFKEIVSKIFIFVLVV
jgi:hypothetical protein